MIHNKIRLISVTFIFFSENTFQSVVKTFEIARFFHFSFFRVFMNRYARFIPVGCSTTLKWTHGRYSLDSPELEPKLIIYVILSNMTSAAPFSVKKSAQRRSCLKGLQRYGLLYRYDKGSA